LCIWNGLKFEKLLVCIYIGYQNQSNIVHHFFNFLSSIINKNYLFASIVIRLFTIKLSFVRWRNPVYVHINMCRTFSPRWETIRLSFLQRSCLCIHQLIAEGHYRLSDLWYIQHPGPWGCDTTIEWKHQLSVPGIEPWISRLKDRAAIHSVTAPHSVQY